MSRALRWLACALLLMLQAHGQPFSESDLKRLVNKDFSWDPLPWHKALKAAHPRLYLANIWQMDWAAGGEGRGSGSLPHAALRVPVTLFTALSVNRLDQLQRQCGAWPGPLVAAVWSPVILQLNTTGSDRVTAGNSSSSAQGPPAQPSPPSQHLVSTPGSATSQENPVTITNSNGTMPSPSPAQGTSSLDSAHANISNQTQAHDAANTTTSSDSTSQTVMTAQTEAEGPAHEGWSMGRSAGPAQIPRAAAEQMEEAMEAVYRALYMMHERRAGGAGASDGHRGGGATASGSSGAGRRRSVLGTGSGSKDGSAAAEAGGKSGQTREQPMGGCDLTVLLFVQPFGDDVMPRFLFPINALRNYAGMMAKTALVTMVDVDLVPNTGFARSVASNATRLAKLEAAAAGGSMLVMPTFEAVSCGRSNCSDGLAEGLAAAAGDKGLVRSMFLNGSLDVFHCNKGLHYAVDYRRWLGPFAEDPYEVSFAQGMEPWYIGHRSLLPFYDVRFVGFGFNKQLQFMYAAGNMGMRVVVLPDAWLVHLPHSHTLASKAFDGRLRRPSTPTPSSTNTTLPINGTNSTSASSATNSTSANSTACTASQKEMAQAKQRLGEQYAADFKSHIWALGGPLRFHSKPRLPTAYKPAIDPALASCLAALPWWRAYRARWKLGEQPGPGDVNVTPPALPSYNGDILTPMKHALHMCSPRPPRRAPQPQRLRSSRPAAGSGPARGSGSPGTPSAGAPAATAKKVFRRHARA